jgi:hypothetical protein
MTRNSALSAKGAAQRTKGLVQTDGKSALNVAVTANGSAPRTYDRRRGNQQVPALQSAATAPIC